MRRYCAYQERCHYEVRSKILTHKIYGHDLEDIMTTLIEEGFLDEQRYAESFTRGKFRMKAWGKVKITQALKAKKISEYCIKKGLAQIDPEEYRDTLIKIISKRMTLTQDPQSFKSRGMLYQYCISRGFESSLVNECLNEILE